MLYDYSQYHAILYDMILYYTIISYHIIQNNGRAQGVVDGAVLVLPLHLHEVLHRGVVLAERQDPRHELHRGRVRAGRGLHIIVTWFISLQLLLS